MEAGSLSKIVEGSSKTVLKLAPGPQPQKDHEQEKLSTQEITQILEALEDVDDPEEYLQQFTQVDLPEQKPGWLESFLSRTFFEHCPKHPIRRNELNKYCIDCDASLCQYCVTLASHDDHRLLKIYRHVYKDVVPLDEMERHIDCSQIQPYRCNRQLVIALSPLPHAGARTNEEVTCQTCKRKLIEYDVYNYCSLSCKVEAFARAREESAPSPPPPPPSSPPPSPPPPPPPPEDKMDKDSKSKRTRKRKGIPHRAPFF